MRLPFWIQALLVGLLVAVLALAVTDVVDNWSDWVVLGVIVFTTIAVAFTRDSDSNW